MITKLFEIRDRGTFIPILAIRLTPSCEAERYLLGRAGYGVDAETQREYVLMAQIAGGDGRLTCDPYDWPVNPRTYRAAHEYIAQHFDELAPGAVVDVQFILGENPQPKRSESMED